MAEPVVSMDVQTYWRYWVTFGVVFSVVFSLGFWAVGYWVVRIAVAAGIADAGRTTLGHT